MQLFIITQVVDLDDSNLSFFHRWLEKLSARADLVVVANRVGRYNLPANVRVFALGGKGVIGKTFSLWGYARKYLRESTGVLAHMCPEYVLAVWPCAKIHRKNILLWYTHKDARWQLRLAEKLVDKIFTASRESFRLPSKKLEATGHGIDTELFAPAGEPDVRRLLTVGRITPSKDLETMILAVKSLRIDGHNVIFDIVGAPYLNEDRIYFQSLEELAQNSGLSGVVKFLGPIPSSQLPDIYRGHGIFLHASKTGSLDKAMLEAMASGLYVVSSSEAFRFLPELYRYHENDAANLAAKIGEIIATKPILNLREIVSREHNLDSLINRISEYFLSKYDRTEK
ncbi:MAG: glycosyltransferase [Patescibacteria group bacterium]